VADSGAASATSPSFAFAVGGNASPFLDADDSTGQLDEALQIPERLRPLHLLLPLLWAEMRARFSMPMIRPA
ncbi:hypothetical protein V5H41_29425, partial [Salmonella enterica]